VARVFISHSSDDCAIAGDVREWLVGDGHSVFLDRDVHDGIAVGEDWQQRLHERLRWADAVVCLVTSSYAASVWCAAEVGVAQSRGSRVLPLLIEPGVVHPLLRSVQHVSLGRSLGTEAGAARAWLAEALRRIDAAGGSGWPDDRSPFPGLQPFDVDQRRVFFGRTAEVNALAELLRSPAHGADAAPLLVVGPSGCGKSSLVRAGLTPVMADETGWLTVPPVLPGADPIAALSRAFAVVARTLGLDWTVDEVRRRLRSEGGLVELADGLMLAAPPPHPRQLLVVIDQFEELLTQTPAAARARFVGLLSTAAGGPVRVVATLRPDFLDQMLVTPEFAVLPTRTYTVKPLQREALAAVIGEPAGLAGIDIDEGLVERLVADTASGDALPLLAYTLAQLAKGVGRGGRLLASRYEQLGGVHGTLTRAADAALDEATSTGTSRDQVIRSLLRLVTVDEHGRPTRWRIPRNELPDDVTAQLEPFVTRRLLTTDSDNGAPTLEVAHESFLTAWPPLSQAVTANATALRARREVERAAEEWANHGRAPTRLWERGQLASALADTGAQLRPVRVPGDIAPDRRERILVVDRVELSPQAREFLQASIRRDRLRRRWSTTILSTLLVLALTAATVAAVQLQVAENQQRLAEHRQRLATARLLLAQAESAVSTQPRTALQLGEAAVRIHPDPETLSGLGELLRTTRYRGSIMADSLVSSVAFAPDGRTLATGGFDGAATLWDLTSPTEPRRISDLVVAHTDPAVDHKYGVKSMAFAPDGRTLATGSSNGTAILWDLTDPSQPRRIGDPLTDRNDGASAVAFAPDGRTLATGGPGGTVILWDLTDPSQPRRIGDPLTVPSMFLGDSVAFSLDGQTLATGSPGGIVMWDLTDRALPRQIGDPLVGPTAAWSVAFAPDGRMLATGGFDGTVILWDLTDPTQPNRIGEPLTGHIVGVSSVAFAPDGHMLATGGFDGTVILWDLTDPTQPNRIGEPLTGHTDMLPSVAFAPDGRTLATGSSGGTTTLWDLTDRAQPNRISEPLTRLAHPVESVAVAPNGRTLVTADSGGTTILWDLTDRARPRHMSELPIGSHDPVENRISSVTISPDGRTLVTVTLRGTATLWDFVDPAHPRRIGDLVVGYTSSADDARSSYRAESLAFAPDGRRLAIGDSEGATILWDLTNPTQPRRVGDPLIHGRGAVAAVVFTPNEHTLVTAGVDDKVILWDLTDPTRPSSTRPDYFFLDESGLINVSQALSPDARMLATTDLKDGTTTLWDLTDPNQPNRISTLTGHPDAVRSVVFAPDGRTLATLDWHGTVLLWDLTDPGRPRRVGESLTRDTTLVNAVAFAPDGKTLVTGDLAGTLILWDLADLHPVFDDALRRACSITRGGLDAAEWSRLIPDLAYVDSCEGT
jgi:WD40 repeat protein